MGNNNSEEKINESNSTEASKDAVTSSANNKGDNKNQSVKNKQRGVVTDCLSLALRDEPSVDGKLISTLTVLEQVEINNPKSTDDFYKVLTKDGDEGYCMKKFITVK